TRRTKNPPPGDSSVSPRRQRARAPAQPDVASRRKSTNCSGRRKRGLLNRRGCAKAHTLCSGRWPRDPSFVKMCRSGKTSVLARKKAEQALYDIIFSGGTVIDGTGAARVTADLAVAGDRIAAVGGLAGAAARATIECRGPIVAPGFI